MMERSSLELRMGWLAWVLALALAALAGCGEDEPRRVWKPSDHGKPPQTQVDPNRIPDRRRTGTDRVDPDQVRVRAAAALWRVSCARCHGQEGRGDGPEAPPDAEMVDMTDPAWQKARTDQQLAQAIREGPGLMPAFAEEIQPVGISALVGHIRAFTAEPDMPDSSDLEAEN